MTNKNVPSAKKNYTDPPREQTRPQSITTMADYWPNLTDGEKKDPARRLEPASKAVTVLNHDNKDRVTSSEGRHNITITLARVTERSKESEWYESYCATCIAVMHIHRDWENPPRHCKDCREKQQAKWIVRPCKKCKADMSVCKEWSNPPDRCDACRSSYRPKKASCHRCHEKFEISVGLQIKVEEMGWKLPTLCKTCRALPKPSRSAGTYLSQNISNRYKTSRVMGGRVRLVSGGSPSSGRKR